MDPHGLTAMGRSLIPYSTHRSLNASESCLPRCPAFPAVSLPFNLIDSPGGADRTVVHQLHAAAWLGGDGLRCCVFLYP